MDLNTWKSKGSYFDHFGDRIFYVREGRGPDLVLIHGFPTASYDFFKIWDELTRKFRVIALDMLGFGFSDKPDRDTYSIREQADRIEGLLSNEGISSAIVLAHDLGDTVAQELLARHNDRVAAQAPGFRFDRLCYLNGGLFPETHRPRLIQRLLASPLGPLVAKAINESKFRKSFCAVFGKNTQPEEQELKDFWHLIITNNGLRNYHRLIRYMQERKRFRDRWVGAMTQASIPQRLINGEADPVSGRHAGERYETMVPGADVVYLEGIGHYPQVEAPNDVLRAFLAFANA